MCFVAAQSFSRALERSSVSVLGNGVLSKPASPSASWTPILIGSKCPWHTWGPGVSVYLEIQVSELLSRLQQAAKAATSSAQLSTMQGPGIYPNPFVLPSGWSDPYSQISRQNYHTPFPYARVFRGPAGIQKAWAPRSGQPNMPEDSPSQRVTPGSLWSDGITSPSSRGTPPTHSLLHQGLQ